MTKTHIKRIITQHVHNIATITHTLSNVAYR